MCAALTEPVGLEAVLVLLGAVLLGAVLLGAVLLVLEGVVLALGAVLLVPLLVEVELLVGAGQSIQKVLCFWGSWEKSSLKWYPCAAGVSPFAWAVAISCWTLITEITWSPPWLVL
jgi:hypothetical protein